MFNNDYIMRMIEQLVFGIAKIMHLKQENKLEESAEVYTGTLRKFFGLNDQSVEQLPWQDLIALSSLGGVQDAEKCSLLAQLIREKADLENLQGRADMAAELYMKALNIYVSALLADNDLDTGANREGVDELIKAVVRYELPMETKRLLFSYYELTGRYAKAEDTLYEMLKGSGDRQEIIETGKVFYLRLLDKTDAELVKGNLPRDEVTDGLSRITAI